MADRCSFCGCKTESGYHEPGCPMRDPPLLPLGEHLNQVQAVPQMDQSGRVIPAFTRAELVWALAFAVQIANDPHRNAKRAEAVADLAREAYEGLGR